MDSKFPAIVDEQTVLQAGGSKTSTGNGTAVDLGSAWAPGLGGLPMQAPILISAAVLDGNQTYSFRLEDSPDNSTFTKRSPDVAVSSANVGNAVAAQGFISQRYVRLVWTITGSTGSSPSITFGDVSLSSFVAE